MELSKERFNLARAYIRDHARVLERQLFAWQFEGGPTDDVLAALGEFQNTDGGFGRALEADVRVADSSAIATTVALQILRRLGADSTCPLVQGAMRYLLNTYDETLKSSSPCRLSNNVHDQSQQG